MKSNTIWILIIILGVIFAALWIYQKFLYFPHAKVLGVTQDNITWSNFDHVKSSMINVSGSGSTGGVYNDQFDYRIDPLPNRQFRFVVFKRKNPQDIRVDNIISFDYPPEYLTK